MNEELRARFLPRFIETARSRLSRAHEQLASQQGPHGVQGELHALAGEASLLGLFNIAELARRGEHAARSWAAGTSDEAMDSCTAALQSLSRDIEALSQGET